jgi:quercetin dioxygenase-like cupin family protein/formiminotetrahydrofolate cyclodeaminase
MRMSTPTGGTGTWSARPLDELLDVLASTSAPVGGGSVAALAAAMAAALLERCAAEAGAESSRVRLAALRSGLADLIDVDAAALVALMRGSAETVDNEVASLIGEAASAPMGRLREVARELTGLAEQLERDGRPALHGEAQCARILASAAGDAAGAIVALNRGLDPAAAAAGAQAELAVADLAPATPGSGPRWGMQSDELNATLLTWPAGHELAAHVNDELEVMLVVLAGSACVTVDGADHHLSADQLLLIPRGCVRAVVAGPDGVRYLSTHRRRGPLLPAPRA